jgi:hypothetical protein
MNTLAFTTHPAIMNTPFIVPRDIRYLRSPHDTNPWIGDVISVSVFANFPDMYGYYIYYAGGNRWDRYRCVSLHPGEVISRYLGEGKSETDNIGPKYYIFTPTTSDIQDYPYEPYDAAYERCRLLRSYQYEYDHLYQIERKMIYDLETVQMLANRLPRDIQCMIMDYLIEYSKARFHMHTLLCDTH